MKISNFYPYTRCQASPFLYGSQTPLLLPPLPLSAHNKLSAHSNNFYTSTFADQVMVGPLTVKEAKPLPPDLEEFVSSSGGNGFIVVSFGSNVGTLSQATVDTLAEAFGKLKQQVVWKLQGN